MRITIKWKWAIALFLVALPVSGQGQPSTDETEEANLKGYVELLRRDIKKDKVSILSELMALSPEESAKFWPVYNEYDKALTAIADERIALIRMYAENYGSMTNPMAAKIMLGVLDLDTKRNQIKRDYFNKMSEALTAIVAARFLQIENQLERILELQIAASLPMVE
jgi:hypothetical protein